MSLFRGLTSGVLASLLLAGSGASACYTYRPMTVQTVPVGTRVVATLTDRGGVELADSVGGTATRLSGRVQATGDERLVLALNRVTFRQGRAVTWAGEPVTVRREYVASVGERKFSWWRTALTSVIVTTGFLYVIDRLGVNIGFFGGPQVEGGGGPVVGG